MSKRPGGLTAMAVLNFVFGGIFLLLYLAAFAIMKAVDEGVQSITDGEVGVPMTVYLYLLLGIVSIAVMITAGVGYLKQSKFLGRTLGNAYACLAIGNMVLSLVLHGGGIGIGFIIMITYPVLTLILLNTTFKDDFIN